MVSHVFLYFLTAQQEAQRAHYMVDKAIQERQQKIVQAEGEAKAATLISFYLHVDAQWLKSIITDLNVVNLFIGYK